MHHTTPTTNGKPDTPLEPGKNAFRYHGIILDWDRNSTQAIGDCPFCGKEDHFYVGKVNRQWDCKVCGQSGNVITFLRLLHERSIEETADSDYQELAIDRGIPVKTLQACKLAKSITTDEWLIPINGRNGIINLLCWREDEDGKRKLECTAGEKQRLYYPDPAQQDHKTVWVCEGPWDAMAWLHVLSCVKANGKPSSASHTIVALPGAGTCHGELAKACSGKIAKDVRLLLDNDKAGLGATDKIVAQFKKDKIKTAKLQTIKWDAGLKDGHDVRDAITTRTPEEAYNYLTKHLGPVTPTTDPDTPADEVFNTFTFAELAAKDLTMSYLVEQILCSDHPCGIIGPVKSLKTTLAIDLAISLATGGRFLNFFNCQKTPVLLMSGESGLPTIRETALRIADAYGFSPQDVSGLWFCERVPKLGNDENLEHLDTLIRRLKPKVLIVDPMYLALDTDGRESSIYKMGPAYASIGNLAACRELGVTVVLCHHTTKHIPIGRAVRLQDVSWAGFAEYVRQWIGLNRRCEYKPGTGKHSLILSAGGSMGHSSLFHVDIAEGTVNHGQSRFWKPSVSIPPDAEIMATKIKSRNTAKSHADAITDYLRTKQSGDTKNGISTSTGINPLNCGTALEQLEKSGTVRQLQIRKGQKTLAGYSLTHIHNGRQTDRQFL